MFVEDSQGGGSLTDGDEFLGPLQEIESLATDVSCISRRQRQRRLP